MKKPKKRRDLNERANAIVSEATEENTSSVNPPPDPAINNWNNEGGAIPEAPPDTSGKNPAAVSLGRLGGLKGGKARAEKVSKRRLSQIGRSGANARLGKVKSTEGEA